MPERVRSVLNGETFPQIEADILHLCSPSYDNTQNKTEKKTATYFSNYKHVGPKLTDSQKSNL